MTAPTITPTITPVTDAPTSDAPATTAAPHIAPASATEGRTKIVATLGPATRDAETLRGLFAAGVNVVRLNFSHGSHADHAAQVRTVREVAAEMGCTVALLQDLQGPKIRTGKLAGGEPVALVPGATLRITTEPIVGTAERVGTTYPELPGDVRPGDRILLDDGLMELRVEGVEGNEVVATVIYGGMLKESKGMNLPGVAVSAPALTPKDREDLAFGASLDVDYVALSFVRRPSDLREARAALRKVNSTAQLIVKVEKPEALDDLPGILDAADGVMVARGDLGVELSPERVPGVQKRLIRLANEREKVVITATQMLESMTANPRPTRAEASDVFNAILDGTDAVMLSGETAVGKYPVATVQMMRRIACEAEKVLPERPAPAPHRRITHLHAIAEAAVGLATSVGARAMVVFTRTGRTAHLVSSLRPALPIYVVTPHAEVVRQLALWWGVHATVAPFESDTDAAVATAEETLVAAGLLAPGDLIVIVSAATNVRDATGNLIKLDVVGGAQRHIEPLTANKIA